MSARFQVITPPACERDVRRATRRNLVLASTFEDMIAILEVDPYNRTKQYDITKLTEVKPGMGQWRIRHGDYRLRYDIFGQDVVLYSFRHRREVY